MKHWLSLIIIGLLLWSCGSGPISSKWQPIGPPIDWEINVVEFLPQDSSIWIAGGIKFGYGFIGHSTDFGRSWRIDSISDQSIYDLHVFSPDRVIAVGNSGRILQSTDGLQSWQLVQIPSFIQLNAVHFSDPATGFIAAGSRYNYGEFYRSVDSGKSWEFLFDMPHMLRDVVFPDLNTGFLAGYGVVLKSMDGGANWDLTTAQGDNFTGIDFISNQEGLVCGQQGSIRKTEDGGQTWRTVSKGNRPVVGRKNLYDIEYHSSGKAYVCGDIGDLFVSFDGGEDWVVITQFTSSRFMDLAILNPQRLLVADIEGNLFLVSE